MELQVKVMLEEVRELHITQAAVAVLEVLEQAVTVKQMVALVSLTQS
jgi:hypothetical protein